MPLVTSEITDDGVGIVTLDDPDRRNAISAAMIPEMVATFDALEGDERVGAIVVTGAGKAFCAGAELGDLASSGDGSVRDIYEGFLRVGRCPLPTIAAVNGAAVGAGMNLALVCDLRLASSRARFITRFLDLGLHPGGGHTWMLRRLIGPQAAAAMVLFGEELDGQEAADIGLVHRCVEPDELMASALALAGRAASAPRALVERVTTSHRRMAAIDDHDDAIDLELLPQIWSLQQPWFAERLAAIKARMGN